MQTRANILMKKDVGLLMAIKKNKLTLSQKTNNSLKTDKYVIVIPSLCSES